MVCDHNLMDVDSRDNACVVRHYKFGLGWPCPYK